MAQKDPRDFVDAYLEKLPTSLVEAICIVIVFNECVAAVFRRGDANSDGAFDIADTVFMLNALFVPGAPAPACLDAADANDDGLYNIADAIFGLNALFIPEDPPPPAPGPSDCGEDPTIDALGVCDSPACP